MSPCVPGRTYLLEVLHPPKQARQFGLVFGASKIASTLYVSDCIFFTVKANDPLQFCFITMEIGLDIFHQRYAAASVISFRARHTFRKFAFAIDDHTSPIGQQKSER